jgi:hypothetical protein
LKWLALNFSLAIDDSITNLDNFGNCHAAIAWRGFQYVLNCHFFFFFALRDMEILARAGSSRVAAQLGSRTPGALSVDASGRR